MTTTDMPEEITMYDVPARLDNSEAIGYLQGYNDAVGKFSDILDKELEEADQARKYVAEIASMKAKIEAASILAVQFGAGIRRLRNNSWRKSEVAAFLERCLAAYEGVA